MEAERVRAQLERVLASTAFVDAERARVFLSFIVNRALEGRLAEIKESVIGVEVLGRSPSFDPKSDSIVRVEARRLRDRLSSYYTGEGRSDVVLISLPKGTYAPEFSERQVSDARESKGRHLFTLAGCVFFGVAVAVFAFVYLRSHTKPAGSADTLRLSILPPEGASFESFAVSPDGRKLAFTATRAGRLMLWVRALDSLEAKPLAGTELAAYPFWSPDSRSIGFSTPSKLKIIETGGGPPRDIAETAVTGSGASWNGDGLILFCPRPLGTIYQVPVSGGTPKPVTSLDATRGEVAHAFPVFLPDGRRFIYFAASSRPGESSIRVGSLDSSNSKVLLSADTSAGYAPAFGKRPASLLFVSDGALIAQALDPRGAVLSGERAVVVPQVRYWRWQQGRFSVSGNGVLLYQGGSGENHQLGWFDRQGRLLEAVGPRNNYEAFSLSPDDLHIAILRNDDPATIMRTIWIMDLSREGVVSRLSDTGVREGDISPVWSPDGREILFSRGDDRRMSIFVQAMTGGPARPVLETDGPKFPTDWSSDARFITFSSQWPDYQNMHTWTMALASRSQAEKPRGFLQHSYDELTATFSPAERGKEPRWIAYTSDETGRNEVYVRDFPAGNQKWQVSTEGGGLPHWRGDGRELFYVAPDGTLMSVMVNPGETFASGTPRVLFKTELEITPVKIYLNQYAVAHDGQRFLLNRRLAETAPAAITAVVPW